MHILTVPCENGAELLYLSTPHLARDQLIHPVLARPQLCSYILSFSKNVLSVLDTENIKMIKTQQPVSYIVGWWAQDTEALPRFGSRIVRNSWYRLSSSRAATCRLALLSYYTSIVGPQDLCTGTECVTEGQCHQLAKEQLFVTANDVSQKIVTNLQLPLVIWIGSMPGSLSSPTLGFFP